MKHFFLSLLCCLSLSTAFSQYWSNDPTFNIGTGATKFSGIMSGPISSMVISPIDQKILITGDFDEFNGVSKQGIVRLNPDGSIDNTFINDSMLNIGAMTLQPDGKILYAGSGFLGRLLSNGTQDSVFNSNAAGLGLTGQPYKIILQPDGKIILGGAMNFLISGVNINSVFRLNSDGTRDTTFNAPAATNSFDVYGLLLQSDGKLIVGGGFTSFSGSSYNNIMRLNSNGSFDYWFDPGIGPDNAVLDLALQPDGKIIAVGNFQLYNGDTTNNLCRINTDGTLDTSFVMGSYLGNFSELSKIRLLSDGKIIGIGSAYPRVFRFNSNGSRDTTFNIGLGANNTVYCMALQDDGKIVLGGEFIKFNGIGKSAITRVGTDCPYNYSIEYVTSAIAYYWPMSGVSYYTSGERYWVLTGSDGCDSTLIINVTIVPYLLDQFVYPSDANACDGGVTITAAGVPPFTFDIGNGIPPVINWNHVTFADLCPGIYSLSTTDGDGVPFTTPVVIPVDSNYIFNNPFTDSAAVDSLGVTLMNCFIQYATIDTAYIDSVWVFGNTVNAQWIIIDSTGSNLMTASYVLDSGNGVYWLQLGIYCPFKSVDQYFAVTQAISFQNGDVSTASLSENKEIVFEIYPNPTNDQVNISFSGSDAELTVYDVQGKTVLKDRIQNQGIVSLQNFERGVYLFDFRNSQGHSVQRVVKQ
jgi:uncharacterized delta-60 repeat protein